MALAITTAQLAVELRIPLESNGQPSDEYEAMLARRLLQAERLIEAYAPSAPASSKVEAAIRFCGYRMDQPTAAAGAMFADAWRHSGAVNELYPWHRVGVVDLDDPFDITDIEHGDTSGDGIPDTPVDPSTPIVPTPTPTPPQATETYYFVVKESTGQPPLEDSFTDATGPEFEAGLMFTGPNLTAVGDADVSRFQTPSFPAGVRQAAFLVAIPDGRQLTTVILDAFRQNVSLLIDRRPDVTIGGETYKAYYFGVYFDSLIGHFWEIYVEDE